MIQLSGSQGEYFVTKHRRKEGTVIDVEISANGASYKGEKLILCICRDITESNLARAEYLKLSREIKELKRKVNKLAAK